MLNLKTSGAVVPRRTPPGDLQPTGLANKLGANHLPDSDLTPPYDLL